MVDITDWQKNPYCDGDYTITVALCPPMLTIRENWETLSKAADSTIFNSTLWIGCWIDKVLNDKKYYALKFHYKEEMIGICILVPAVTRRHSLIKSHCFYINELPLDGRNMVIEYNDILVKDEHRKKFAVILGRFLGKTENWNEIVLSGFTETATIPILEQSSGSVQKYCIKESTARGVDLKSLREKKLELPTAILSKNKRAQIHRSIRRYEKEYGNMKLHTARHVEEARAFFMQMGELHTEYWRDKGQSGSFVNLRWLEFHRALIDAGYANDHIQMIRVSFGTTVIGYVYNLKWMNKIYNIQSGFHYSGDNRDKPGLVSHYLAIKYCYESGIDYYDMLAGDEDYKKSFANSETRMTWMVLQRKNVWFQLETLLKKVKAGIRSL